MSLRDDLIAAKALIDTPEKWAENGAVRRADHKMCAVDAICAVHTGNSWEMRNALLMQAPAGCAGVAVFNDLPTTKHADIMALFDRAIKAAEAA